MGTNSPAEKRSFVIGITGRSGSGKTHLIRRLREHFSVNELAVISEDNYYRPRHLQQKDGKGLAVFDLPDSIYTEEFFSDIQQLKQGNIVTRNLYTYNHNKQGEVLQIQPAPILLIEGIFTLYYPFLREEIDWKVFIETPEEICLQRRLKRDVKERGYTKEEIFYRFQEHHLPNYERYVVPVKPTADYVFSGATETPEELDIFINTLRKKAGIA